jgi:hypothetical protein
VGMFAPASARGLLSCRATKLQWHIFFATARGKRHEGAQECNDGDFLALHGTDLRLAALVLRAPLCPMPINAQGSIAIPASKSVDKTRMPRDLRAQIDAILPLVATNGRAPRENTTEGGSSAGHRWHHGRNAQQRVALGVPCRNGLRALGLSRPRCSACAGRRVARHRRHSGQERSGTPGR